jgi:uncharacterized protein YqjF (DUF2071 family)
MNFLTAHWSNLIMANYEVSPDLLQPYVPPGTELDFYHGKTYLSLVGFMFLKTKIFGVPIPGLGDFEEVNLRFYVTREIGNEIKRGVVFINETVPFKPVAWLANQLYGENYTSVPTKHEWLIDEATKQIDYSWKMNDLWNHLKISALSVPNPLVAGSIEEFIFEHYWGYAGSKGRNTTEYQIDHLSWQTNPVESYSIACDFASMYGPDFALLSDQKPASVLLAEGSPVSVKWKRTKIT